MDYPRQITINFGDQQPYTMGKSLLGNYYSHNVGGNDLGQIHASHFIKFLEAQGIESNVTYGKSTLTTYNTTEEVPLIKSIQVKGKEGVRKLIAISQGVEKKTGAAAYIGENNQEQKCR